MKLLKTLILLSILPSLAFANPFVAPTDEDLIEDEPEIAMCEPENPIEMGMDGVNGINPNDMEQIALSEMGIQQNNFTNKNRYRLVATVNGVDVYYDLVNDNYVENE